MRSDARPAGRLAAKEPEYIRPVLLFQAEARNGEVTVDALLAT
jgi:hypothetical protein